MTAKQLIEDMNYRCGQPFDADDFNKQSKKYIDSLKSITPIGIAISPKILWTGINKMFYERYSELKQRYSRK